MEQFFEQSVKDELKSMDQRLYDLEEKMNSIDTKLTQVVDAILGNPLTKTGGFMNDIDILKHRIEELEKKAVAYDDFKKRVYWAAGIIISLALIAQYVTNIYANVKR